MKEIVIVFINSNNGGRNMENYKYSGMRVLIDKELYKKLKMYCIIHNTTISKLLRNYIYSMLKTDTVGEEN